MKRFVRKPSRFAVLLTLMTLCAILVPLCIGGAVWALTGSVSQAWQSFLICLAIEGAAVALAGGLYLIGAAIGEAAQGREAQRQEEEEYSSPSSPQKENLRSPSSTQKERSSSPSSTQKENPSSPSSIRQEANQEANPR